MSFILDRDRLIARKKVVPGNAQQSPLWKRVAAVMIFTPNSISKPARFQRKRAARFPGEVERCCPRLRRDPG